MDYLISTLILLFGFVIDSTFGADAEWNYGGEDHGYAPADWKSQYPLCGKKRQSPIDFTSESIEYMTDMPAFEFTNSEKILQNNKFELYNNGHAVGVQVKIPEDGGAHDTANIRGGGLNGSFHLINFHFHWGSDNSQGSEHTHDGTAFAGELHLVHRNDRHNDSQAFEDEDGLAVLGIWIEVGEEDDSHHLGLTDFTNYLSNVSHGEMKSEIPVFPMAQMLPENRTDFFRYDGSLTTPPCHEAVIWTVFTNPIRISPQQMAQFRALEAEPGRSASNGYRPVQALYDRKIFANFPKSRMMPASNPAANPTPAGQEQLRVSWLAVSLAALLSILYGSKF